jgi:dynein heavy chain
MNRTGGSGEDNNLDQVRKMASDFLSLVPEPFRVKDVEMKFPFTYEESMNTVLLQELARFNRLIEVIRNSILTFEKSLEGLVSMTEDMEELLQSF